MKKTQSEQILEYLSEKGSITPMDALMKFHCMRLGARIHELKAEGYHIRTEMESHKSEDGRIAHYARYILVK